MPARPVALRPLLALSALAAALLATPPYVTPTAAWVVRAVMLGLLGVALVRLCSEPERVLSLPAYAGAAWVLAACAAGAVSLAA